MEDYEDNSIYQSQDDEAENLELPDQVTWEASEFIVQEKNPLWYTGFFAISAILVVLLYLMTRDFVSVAIVIAVLCFIFVYAQRQPKVMRYVINRDGITLGDRTYYFNEFRSFALIQEGGIMSIALHPLQRFALPLSIYFDPAHMGQIIDILSYHLPNEAGRLGIIDVWSRKLRL